MYEVSITKPREQTDPSTENPKGGIIFSRDTLVSMPIISAFFGIMIRMFYREHEPARFHAEYQGQLAKFSFDGKMTAGHIDSKTAKRLIRQWAVLHRSELEANWQKMKAGQTLDRIAPLE